MKHYEHVTFVMALPRSRTAWMAHTFGQLVQAHHEPLRECASIGELRLRVDDWTRRRPDAPLLIVDTAAVFFHQQIAEHFPHAARIFVERNPDHVRQSLERIGISGAHVALAEPYYRAARAAAPGRLSAIRLRYEELDRPATLELMARFIGYAGEIQPGFWEQHIAMNIQADVEQLRRSVDRWKARALFRTATQD